MSGPARCCVLVSPQPQVRLPASAQAPGPGGLRWHRSRAVQGAELEGPWMVRVTVVLPLGPRPARAVMYGARWLGAVHLRWLSQMGLQCVGPYFGPSQSSWAAFLARSPGDVLVGTRKMCSVGEVFHRGKVLLVASTLLHPPPWGLLRATMARPAGEAGELEDSSLAASMLLGRRVDAEAWAANLRRLLHLSLGMPQLQEVD